MTNKGIPLSFWWAGGPGNCAPTSFAVFTQHRATVWLCHQTNNI